MSGLTRRRTAVTLSILLGLLAATGLAALLLGAERVPFHRLVDLLIGPRRGDGPPDVSDTIILQIRGPRIALAGLVGAVLGLTGAVLQSLLRNPLAEPHLIGVSSGAALGVMIGGLWPMSGLIRGLTTTWVFAFAGGMVALVMLYRLSTVNGRIRPETLVLAGVVLNGTLAAVIMFLTSYLDPGRVFGRVVWLMGNLGSAESAVLWLTGPVLLAGMAWLCAQGQPLNLMTLGADTAQSLGLRPDRVIRASLVVSASMIGLVVSLSGMIGFVGILTPHILRRLIGTDYRLLLPASALGGAMFLIVADTAARVALAPTELPVGVVTALCGGPFFLWLLARQRRAVMSR
ncbi:MAG: FecCD family ABC transporter permease [Nitrospirota bacterium]